MTRLGRLRRSGHQPVSADIIPPHHIDTRENPVSATSENGTSQTNPHTSSALGHVIEWGLLILLALMPFHAFLSVWLSSAIGHRTLIQGWKEGWLVVLGSLTVALVWRERSRLERLRRPLVLAAGALAALAAVVSAATHPGWTAIAFGAKTDLEWLAALVIALLVASPQLARRAVSVTLACGAVVIGFGLLQIYAWPPDFLTHFGYGPGTIQPYLLLDPVTRALRFPATLGGPNQLGAYLALILSLALAVAVRRHGRWLWLLALLPAGAVVLLHTYSRAAWVGVALALLITGLSLLPVRWRRAAAAAAVIVGVAALLTGPWLLSHSGRLSHYLRHDNGQATTHNSDTDHAASLEQGAGFLVASPFGHGLGSAGPAVFHTGSGPVIEDQYLQIGYELGWAGLVLWLAITGLILSELGRRAAISPTALAAAATLAGLSVSALVLPIWADSTLALCFAIITGVIIGVPIPKVRDV